LGKRSSRAEPASHMLQSTSTEAAMRLLIG
jgi:hypothetical protein